jgi:hypothetical protein
MIFFFGSRATKIKERKLRKTTCPYCQTQDSFVVSTFSKYFHFFWIPIIPLFKTHIAECTHCKKSYSQHQFSSDMKVAFQREDDINPAKRPLWQGIGCLILVSFFTLMFTISFYGVYTRSQDEGLLVEEKDDRKALLDNDYKKIRTSLHREKDSISFALKQCVDYDIQNGIDTEKVEYYSSINENKILVLLRIKDIKEIAANERKVIIQIVEDCLMAMPNMDSISKYYIGVKGKWNTVLVKTPSDADLTGRFADKNKLLPFYGEKQIDAINPTKTNLD